MFNKVEIQKNNIRKMGIYKCNGAQTPLQWYHDQTDKPDIVCNASFFEWLEDGSIMPCYSLAINHKIIQQESLFKGMCINGTNIFIGDVRIANYVDFVSAAPTILEDGVNVITQAHIDMLKAISGKEPRTVIGWNKDSISVIVVDGRTSAAPGLTLAELPAMCSSYGLTDAVNLDGGYSSMLVVNGTMVNKPLKTRGVYSVFAIWLKKGEPIMDEWKSPNWTWLSGPYVQVTKDGTVKSQNRDREVALKNAEKEGWAVWEKSTKLRIYPVASAPPQVTSGEKTFLEGLRDIITQRLETL